MMHISDFVFASGMGLRIGGYNTDVYVFGNILYFRIKTKSSKN